MVDQMDVEGDQYQIKPMNCPFHVLMYKNQPRSYKSLPLRWAELGTVYRYICTHTHTHTVYRYICTHTQTHTHTHTHTHKYIYEHIGTKTKRYERSGTLSGLFRVRGFTQDDAHVFCLPEQVSGVPIKVGLFWPFIRSLLTLLHCSDEIFNILNLTEDILSKFGFKDYEIFLSTRPDKSIGDDKVCSLTHTKPLH